jgi:hypothetical protein
MSAIWQWLKDNDAPNWFGIAFSLFIWPTVLYWWYNRRFQSLPHLEVLPTPDRTIINGHQYDAVAFTFTNRTDSVVYLSQARLRENRRNFPIPMAAVADLSGGWREIKFRAPNSNALIDQERVVHTGQSAYTSIAVEMPLGNEFYAYRPSLYRWAFRLPKYFVFEYLAMRGDKKYYVATVH